MSQPVSAAFTTAQQASVNDVTFAYLVAWDKVYDPLAQFFKIGTSAINGPDFLKGGGADETFFDKYKFQEETAYVDDISVSRMSSLKPYGVFAAQANVTLDNIGKRFMPGYDPTIGDYVNKSRRPMKIAVGFGSERLQQFVGFSDRPRSALMAGKTTMHAMDVMDYFSTVEPVTKYYEGYKFDEVIEDILLELGFASDQFLIESSLQTAPGFLSLSGMTAKQVFDRICESEQAVMFADETGVIHFWNRAHFFGLANGVTLPTYDYSNMTDVEWNDTPVTNWIKVSAYPRAVMAVQPVWSSSSAVEVPGGQTITVTMPFEDEDGKLPVTSVMDPVYIDDVDDLNRSFYTTNYNQDGSGAPGNTAITVTGVSLVGDVAFVEFHNSGGLPVYLLEIEMHGTPAKIVDRIEVEYKDEDSIEKYGINPESNNGEPIEITNNWIQDAATALSLAREPVELYGDPEQQVACTVFGNPARQYGDPINLKINDVDSDYRPAVVVGTELKMSMGKILAQKLIFEYRETLIQQLFTINVSSIGGTHVIAP